MLKKSVRKIPYGNLKYERYHVFTKLSINSILDLLCMTNYNSAMQIKIKKIMTTWTFKFVQSHYSFMNNL